MFLFFKITHVRSVRNGRYAFALHLEGDSQMIDTGFSMANIFTGIGRV